MLRSTSAITEYRENREQDKKVRSHILSQKRSLSGMEKLGEVVFYPKKHVLVEAGQYNRYCYIVKKGRVLSYEICANGEERIYHFYEKNSVFLEDHVLFGEAAAVSFRTDCSTELIRIDKNTLLLALKRDPQLALDLIAASSGKFQSSMEQIRHEKNHSILWKICDLFLTFVDCYGEECMGQIYIREKISQQMISNMLGINRITAVRAIKELKEKGLIGQLEGYYYIADIERLLHFQQEIEK